MGSALRLQVHLPPLHVPRFVRQPLGDGQPLDVGEFPPLPETVLLTSIVSGVYLSNHREALKKSIAQSHASLHGTLHEINKRWWGQQRVDLVLYCPEGIDA